MKVLNRFSLSLISSLTLTQAVNAQEISHNVVKIKEFISKTVTYMCQFWELNYQEKGFNPSQYSEMNSKCWSNINFIIDEKKIQVMKDIQNDGGTNIHCSLYPIISSDWEIWIVGVKTYTQNKWIIISCEWEKVK